MLVKPYYTYSTMKLNTDTEFASEISKKYLSRGWYYFAGVSLTYLKKNGPKETERDIHNKEVQIIKNLIIRNSYTINNYNISQKTYINSLNTMIHHTLNELGLYNNSKNYDVLRKVYQITNSELNTFERNELVKTLKSDLVFMKESVKEYEIKLGNNKKLDSNKKWNTDVFHFNNSNTVINENDKVQINNNSHTKNSLYDNPMFFNEQQLFRRIVSENITDIVNKYISIDIERMINNSYSSIVTDYTVNKKHVFSKNLNENTNKIISKNRYENTNNFIKKSMKQNVYQNIIDNNYFLPVENEYKLAPTHNMNNMRVSQFITNELEKNIINEVANQVHESINNRINVTINNHMNYLVENIINTSNALLKKNDYVNNAVDISTIENIESTMSRKGIEKTDKKDKKHRSFFNIKDSIANVNNVFFNNNKNNNIDSSTDNTWLNQQYISKYIIDSIESYSSKLIIDKVKSKIITLSDNFVEKYREDYIYTFPKDNYIEAIYDKYSINYTYDGHKSDIAYDNSMSSVAYDNSMSSVAYDNPMVNVVYDKRKFNALYDRRANWNHNNVQVNKWNLVESIISQITNDIESIYGRYILNANKNLSIDNTLYSFITNMRINLGTNTFLKHEIDAIWEDQNKVTNMFVSTINKNKKSIGSISMYKTENNNGTIGSNIINMNSFTWNESVKNKSNEVYHRITDMNNVLVSIINKSRESLVSNIFEMNNKFISGVLLKKNIKDRKNHESFISYNTNLSIYNKGVVKDNRSTNFVNGNYNSNIEENLFDIFTNTSINSDTNYHVVYELEKKAAKEVKARVNDMFARIKKKSRESLGTKLTEINIKMLSSILLQKIIQDKTGNDSHIFNQVYLTKFNNNEINDNQRTSIVPDNQRTSLLHEKHKNSLMYDIYNDNLNYNNVNINPLNKMLMHIIFENMIGILNKYVSADIKKIISKSFGDPNANVTKINNTYIDSIYTSFTNFMLNKLVKDNTRKINQEVNYNNNQFVNAINKKNTRLIANLIETNNETLFDVFLEKIIQDKNGNDSYISYITNYIKHNDVTYNNNRLNSIIGLDKKLPVNKIKQKLKYNISTMKLFSSDIDARQSEIVARRSEIVAKEVDIINIPTVSDAYKVINKNTKYSNNSENSFGNVNNNNVLIDNHKTVINHTVISSYNKNMVINGNKATNNIENTGFIKKLNPIASIIYGNERLNFNNFLTTRKKYDSLSYGTINHVDSAYIQPNVDIVQDKSYENIKYNTDKTIQNDINIIIQNNKKGMTQNNRNNIIQKKINDIISNNINVMIQNNRNNIIQKKINDTIHNNINVMIQSIRNDTIQNLRNDTIQNLRNDMTQINWNDTAQHKTNDIIQSFRNNTIQIYNNNPILNNENDTDKTTEKNSNNSILKINNTLQNINYETMYSNKKQSNILSNNQTMNSDSKLIMKEDNQSNNFILHETNSKQEDFKEEVQQYINENKHDTALLFREHSEKNNEIKNHAKEIVTLKEKIKEQEKMIFELKRNSSSEYVVVNEITQNVMNKLEKQMRLSKLRKGR